MLDLIVALLMATLPPCSAEDGQWCTWDAQTKGNGQGTSFVSLSEDFRIEY